ncbi:MAG: tetraacyldisaccharide 4'-kinase [Sulfurifustaceae bacterium]
MADFARWIEREWQTDGVVSRLLAPLAWLYGGAVTLNRHLYRAGWRRSIAFPVPVVVVGNVTVGGTGKTPLVLWVVRYLRERGWRPGIVTRGYGGDARAWPQNVRADSDPSLVGDEPVLLARRSSAPVIADPDRPRAVRELLKHGCNVVVSDDGLQHYRLRRDVEIAVIDASRGLGNGRCLPAGPLREPAVRLRQVDARVRQGGGNGDAWPMRLVPLEFRQVQPPHRAAPLAAFRGRTVHAAAGIGHPPRFFGTLRGLGVGVIEHAFPDHYRFQRADLPFADGRDVIMTEKDAVKCERFAADHWWYLAVEADLDPAFGDWLLARLGKPADG